MQISPHLKQSLEKQFGEIHDVERWMKDNQAYLIIRLKSTNRRIVVRFDLAPIEGGFKSVPIMLLGNEKKIILAEFKNKKKVKVH